MEINAISPTTSIEKVAAAVAAAAEAMQAEADAHAAALSADSHPTLAATQALATAHVHPQAAETLARGGFVERILGETQSALASAPADLPGERVDRNLETGTLQSHARHTSAGVERPQTALHADAAVPSGGAARTEFALPAAMLVPAALVGLQVEHAAAWPLNRRGFDPDPVAPSAAEEDEHAKLARLRDEAERKRREEEESAGDEPAEAAPVTEEPHDTCQHVFAADSDDDWCEALTAVLGEALGSKVPPHALLLAAEQWQRGRCVVLACPQGFDAAGPAWAFVLWPKPRRAGQATGKPAPLALFGVRVEARLQWSALPRGPKWFHVRVIKEHHPQRGRQLIPNTPGTTGAVPCEVQLGPVLARALRCCDVCVRIHSAQRFWAALGQQWSMQVVVSSMPLLPRGGPAMEETR